MGSVPAEAVLAVLKQLSHDIRGAPVSGRGCARAGTEESFFSCMSVPESHACSTVQRLCDRPANVLPALLISPAMMPTFVPPHAAAPAAPPLLQTWTSARAWIATKSCQWCR